jgi:hypothetical protein
MRVCEPVKPLQGAGKSFEYLDSIVTSHFATPIRVVIVPRIVASSNMISIEMNSMFAHSFSVVRESWYKSLGHTSGAPSTNSAPFVFGEASATLLQSTD